LWKEKMRLNAGPQVAHTMTWILGRSLLLSVAVAVLCAGCGWRSSDDATKPTAAKPVTRKSVNATDELLRNMVSAVAANKPSSTPIQVKFDLRDRPQVGQPADVDLAIVPMSASVDRVSGTVAGEEGLEIVDGAQIAATEHPAEGSPIRQSVKILPKQPGIFTVHALVTVEAAGQTTTETYAIPLIAAVDGPDAPGKRVGPSATAAVAAAAPARVGESAAHTTVPPGTAAAQ
jgi:hypothetical protein